MDTEKITLEVIKSAIQETANQLIDVLNATLDTKTKLVLIQVLDDFKKKINPNA